ncbi:hypothetical protein ACGFI5_01750 [Micromonospora tulbaghiae]|uniref:Uncharacterized protein n=1 Tax=Micromonospora tulbaghiae TaxID=479978 RepID=A0ABY0KGP0_9ACTN|nr:hypothetical protein [Micromonospora tulbaghiae]MDX5456296.1 hypothetical protein [Micromonospora tulbaghiae]SCE69672.1 hypothetical protein GA0070562_1836 [Micromonospora tulbaghiae]
MLDAAGALPAVDPDPDPDEEDDPEEEDDPDEEDDESDDDEDDSDLAGLLVVEAPSEPDERESVR